MLCPNTSPDGDPCIRQQGHQSKRGKSRCKVADGREFYKTCGVVVWYESDDGYMTEADYQTWGRL